ncbi:MAG: hypothetical protein JXX29_06095 [Deltaproteobacteria bacterium]|nr:hypothetical protein [Deltaproteobacteria bacterium]MBN2671221.1 hypothetical protein [Deltaproteobacteria bacterium]
MILSNPSLALRLLPALLAAFLFASCNDSGDDSSNNNGNDSDNPTDETDDTDTMPPTPYDAVDCAGLGNDPAACEYVICEHEEWYDTEAINCEKNPTDRCEGMLACYQTEFACLINACPMGTALPETHDEKSEAGIYDCDNLFLSCTSELPEN